MTSLIPERTEPPVGRFVPRADIMMAATASMLAIFAVLFVIGFVALNHAQEISIRQSAINREARVAAYGLIQASIDAETGQRGYLLTNDPVFLTPYRRGKIEAAAQLATQGLHVTQHVVVGEPVTVLARLADELKVDLLSLSGLVPSISATLGAPRQPGRQ